MAWTATGTWNRQHVQGYRAHVALRCPQMYARHEYIDCANLCLKLLVEYAYRERLPVVIEGRVDDRYTVFDSGDRAHSTWESFQTAVLEGIEANELFDGHGSNFGNTYGIHGSDLASGDMLAHLSGAAVGSRSGTWGHAQLVFASVLHFPHWGAVPDWGSAVIYQGNLDYGLFGSHPTMVQHGVYWFDEEGRFWYRRDNGPRQDAAALWRRSTIKPVRWNFAQFNSGPRTPMDRSLY